jgi:hypothetical protein
MAGLIQSNQAADTQPVSNQADIQAAAEAAGQTPVGGMLHDTATGGPNENDPTFQQALEFAMTALYKAGAAKGVAKSLRANKDRVEALANVAYEVTSVVDERTEGRVPDELLVLLASRILEEVVDIAQAANIQVAPSEIGEAMKQMILRFLGEQGVDTSQLQAAMDKVNPEDFNRVAAQEA